MKNTIQVHPETLARFMLEAREQGIDNVMDYLGLSRLQIVANPDVPIDKMKVPDEWLTPQTNAKNNY